MIKHTMKYLFGCANALAVCVVPLGAGAASSTPNAAPVVQTTGGKIEGQYSQGVYSFLGIHYGADTGGKNRFLPPQPVASWTGIKRADQMGLRCPQPPVNMPGEMGTVLSFSDLPIGEDCLVLNVWTPGPKDGAKRPVMVWLHGGGFFVGSGGDKYYEGSNLSRKQDIVLVTLNHRLNLFGYLHLGDAAGPAYADSNLAGMLDIVQALKWVKDNIGQFGGDPGNVTIFGQSGGAGKTSTLLAMPAAQGLFHKAIMMSGGGVRVGSLDNAVATRDKVLGFLGVKPNEIEKLQAIPMDDLIKAAGKASLLAFGPVMHGKNLPMHPFDPAASPLQAKVPVMVGSTKDEATNIFLTDPTWQTMTEADLDKRVAAIIGPERAKQAIDMYRANAPQDKPMHLWTSIVTDQMFTNGAITLAERKVTQGTAPIYMYKINWESPVLGGKLRAPHAVELPFVFDTVSVSAGLVGAGPGQDKMAQLMSSTFAAFARTGNPNVKGYPTWPTYTLDKRETFIYDTEPKVVSDPNHTYRVFWQEQAKLLAKNPGSANSAIKDAFDKKKFE
jgi:para-nitrobenzyl esterase